MARGGGGVVIIRVDSTRGVKVEANGTSAEQKVPRDGNVQVHVFHVPTNRPTRRVWYPDRPAGHQPPPFRC